jgi:hypothetical protein
MQYDISNSQVVCSNPGQPIEQLVAVGRENLGSRFLLGLVSLADAARYDLPTAQLETQRTTATQSVFTTAAGRSFVAPTSDSLVAAAKMMTPDDAVGSWTTPYDSMRLAPAGIGAYPGVLLVSTDIPTQGLGKTDAHNLANFLTYAIGPGQVPGLSNGQLPLGYVPLTAANGLSGMAKYTELAIADVSAQQCVVPYPSGKAQPAPSCNLPSPPHPGNTGGGSSSGSTSTPPPVTSGGSPTSPGGGTVSTGPTKSKVSPKTKTLTPSPSASSLTPGPAAATYTSGAPGLALPAAALLALLGFGLSMFLSRRGSRS